MTVKRDSSSPKGAPPRASHGPSKQRYCAAPSCAPTTCCAEFLEKKCKEKGLKLTGPRKAILRAIAESPDHPDVEALHKRVKKQKAGIGVATVYRTVKLFEEKGIVNRHEFGDGRARFEETSGEHHDHLIDIDAGTIVEFTDPEIERLQKSIAKKLGYELIAHRLDLYCIPLKKARP